MEEEVIQKKYDKKDNGKNDTGRPTVMTDIVIAKLEHAFTREYSDREACFYANISLSSLYDYCKEKPEFGERKELLKESPKLKAKETIYDNMDKVSNAQWYLERKVKDEYGEKTSIEVTNKELISRDKYESIILEVANEIRTKREGDGEAKDSSGV